MYEYDRQVIFGTEHSFLEGAQFLGTSCLRENVLIASLQSSLDTLVFQSTWRCGRVQGFLEYGRLENNAV